jgi:hypothetical protein
MRRCIASLRSHRSSASIYGCSFMPYGKGGKGGTAGEAGIRYTEGRQTRGGPGHPGSSQVDAASPPQQEPGCPGPGPVPRAAEDQGPISCSQHRRHPASPAVEGGTFRSWSGEAALGGSGGAEKKGPRDKPAPTPSPKFGSPGRRSEAHCWFWTATATLQNHGTSLFELQSIGVSVGPPPLIAKQEAIFLPVPMRPVLGLGRRSSRDPAEKVSSRAPST